MRHTILPLLLLSTCFVLTSKAYAQDSVDVTFRYAFTGVTVYLVGEFNGWNNTRNPMDYAGTYYYKTIRLRVGGNPSPNPVSGVVGAWQYKFYYAGVTDWPNDPQNHHVNSRDNGNTFIYTKDPTILYFLPNQRNPNVSTALPTISAYLYPKVGTTVDTSTIQLTIDGNTVTNLGSFYNTSTKQLSYTPTVPLPNGLHTVILRAGSMAGGSNADTVSFITQAGYVQITSLGGYATLNPKRTLYGIVENPSITSIKLVRNSNDTTVVAVSSGTFTAVDTLEEGLNTFVAVADSSGIQKVSSPVTYTYRVNHAPTGVISFVDGGSTVQLSGASSTDPDAGQTATLSYLWAEDPSNPAPIGGITGITLPSFSVSRPTVPGEYYVGLIVKDVDGNADTTRSYFTLSGSGSFSVPSLALVPSWVRQGRLYEMFFKSHTAAGTINAAIPDLDRIAAMGYNIIWVMPVMANRDPINNSVGPGYNIVDFYRVAPEYGTNDDFKNFVARAHQLGMKVILDVTPNHTSAGHPFVLDARLYGKNSRYWSYYQHAIVPYTGPGLGAFGSAPNHEQYSSSGFIYYGPFSDGILNYNWSDIDARQYMIDVYAWWIKEIGIDGYRLDVYWGPHIRTNSPNGGETDMGVPMRSALKHIRPDIYLLGEAEGVGVGTEVLYADSFPPGGVESAYDWNLKNLINSSSYWSQAASSRVSSLDATLRNYGSNAGMGFTPGANSYFMRFLENHDEDRIAYQFSVGTDTLTAIKRTQPVSTAILLAVGMPMVYAGEEVGRGIGITDYDQRRRGVIQWNTFSSSQLMPHYQKLAQIRKQYPAFTTQQMVKLSTSVGSVYAYSRPYAGQNGITIANLDGVPAAVTVTLQSGGGPAPLLGITDGKKYYVSDLYNAKLDSVVFTGGTANLSLNLPAFGSAVMVLDTVARSLVLPSLTGVDEDVSETIPTRLSLEQNYPNPFNPATTIRYQIPTAGFVSLKVYNLLGQEVATLVAGYQSPGTYSIALDASRLSTGMYIYRLQNNSVAETKKMLLLK